MPIDNQIPKLYTYREAAELLQIHEGSLRRLVSQGQLDHYKVGRAVRFSREMLLDRNLKKAAS